MSREHNGEKADLLVVDDNRVNRLLVARTLEVVAESWHNAADEFHRLVRRRAHQRIGNLRPRVAELAQRPRGGAMPLTPRRTRARRWR